jgi:hypothetical protein
MQFKKEGCPICKVNKFEEFLMDRHAEEYTGAGDDITDAFDDWISNLNIDEWLNYGEWFANKTAKEMLEKRIKELEKCL